MPGILPPHSAFTFKANGIANVLLSEVDVYQPIPGINETKVKFKAIWDTGATSTVITPQVVQRLGLIPSGKANLRGVNSNKENALTYRIVVVLPNGVKIDVYKAVEADVVDADLLIGMDIIALGDFSITNVGQRTCFSFRFPSLKTIDYVEEINLQNAQQQKKHDGHKVISAPMRFGKVDGNAFCPCGSGKKWKQCHGKPHNAFRR